MTGRTTGLRAIAGLALATVLMGGCAGAAEVPGAAYDATVDYFDRVAAEQEPEPRPSADDLRRYAPRRGAAAEARPVRVAVPAIGVRSSLERLGVADDGAIQTPRDWQRAGWFRGGPRPGELGAAVILGHVDSTTGPAVFFELRKLSPGD